MSPSSASRRRRRVSRMPALTPGKIEEQCNADEGANSTQSVSRWLRQSPAAWIGAILVAALTAYLAPAITEFLNAKLPSLGAAEAAGGPAIDVVNIEHFVDVQSDSVLPDGVTQDSLASWDRRTEPTESWLQVNEAVPLDAVEWQIALVGRRTEPVAITNMKPILREPCSSPIGGVLIEDAGPLGGGSGATTLETEISSFKREFTYSGPDGQVPFFGRNTIMLPKGEKTFVLIRAITLGPHCRWHIEMEYLADGKRQSIVLRPPGREVFEVTGRLDPNQYDSVFLGSDRICTPPYRQVSGREYALLLGRGEAQACGG